MFRLTFSDSVNDYGCRKLWYISWICLHWYSLPRELESVDGTVVVLTGHKLCDLPVEAIRNISSPWSLQRQFVDPTHSHLKLEKECSSEPSVSTRNTTWYQNLKNNVLKHGGSENLKPYTEKFLKCNLMFFSTMHHSIELFHVPILMHNSLLINNMYITLLSSTCFEH